MPDDHIVCDEEDLDEGTFKDPEKIFEELTDDEAEMGETLGKEIDVDDDEDNGSATIEAIKEMTQ